MESLKTLPDLQGRKFGSLAFGYDRIEQMRMEFSVLESLAALVCGCEREEVTIPKVQQAIAKIQAEQALDTTP